MCKTKSFLSCSERIEQHMKDYVRGPTEALLIEALETLQNAA